MATKYYAAEPMFITLSDHKGTLLYREVLWNIMRMLLMEREGITAETALTRMDDLPTEEYAALKAEAATEYAAPEFQQYMERIHLYPETVNAPKLQPVETLLKEENEKALTETEAESRLMEVLNEYPWGMFAATYLNSSEEMD